ncbi:MAG TPA: transposase [Rhodanobacteraceae bacterium]
MQAGFRFRCYPTRVQQATLVRWIGCQRFIYNAKVGEDRYFRRFASKALSLAGQRSPVDQQYSQFKSADLTPWLAEVPSVILRNGAVRWKQAYGRFFQRLAHRPRIHRKAGSQSVWLTREMFRFEQAGEPVGGKVVYRLSVGTSKFPVGEIDFIADREYRLPASIVLSVDAGRWFLSFAAVNQGGELDPAEIAQELRHLPEAELAAATIGVDRGVVIPICAGPGAHYDFMDVQKRRLAKKEHARRRWQRRMARRQKGSAGRRKAQRRVARNYGYAKRVRHDFAHQTSHLLVSNPAVRLIVFEDLRVANMVRKPKAKRDADGRWQKNGASGKAGLNRRILDSAWSQTKTYTQYKALRHGKLCIAVPPAYSSQECSQCGYTAPENRPTQARFLCQVCGYQANADDNASAVIGKRGVMLIRSGEYHLPKPKHTMRLRNKVGTERSKPLPIGRPRQRRLRQDAVRDSRATHESLMPETPAIAAQAA